MDGPFAWLQAANGVALALAAGAAACSPFEAQPSDSADASAGADAASDGGTRADAATKGGGAPSVDPCTAPPPGALFCEDFETEKPLFGFTESYGSEVTMTKRVAVTGRGQVLSYQTSTTSMVTGSWLRFAPAAAAADLTFDALELSMDVAIVRQDVPMGVVAAFWLLDGNASPDLYGIAASSMGAALGAWMPSASGLSTPVNAGEWHSVKLRLQREPGVSTFQRIASVDGVVVDHASVTTNRTTWDMRIGFYYGNYGVAELLVDNVLVTRR